MAEWLKVLDVARLMGYGRSGVTYLIHNGVIPLIIEHRERMHNRQIATEDAQYVADPNGEYLGFELTPDEAARLKAIRELHRQYPSCKERYPAMMRMLGDG